MAKKSPRSPASKRRAAAAASADPVSLYAAARVHMLAKLYLLVVN